MSEGRTHQLLTDFSVTPPSSSKKRKAPSENTEDNQRAVLPRFIKYIDGGDTEKIAQLIQKNRDILNSHIKSGEFQGSTPLMAAIWWNKNDIVHLLLSLAENPLAVCLSAVNNPARSDHGMTIACFAVTHNKIAALKTIFKALKTTEEQQQFCNSACQTGPYLSSTPLMFACSMGYRESVNMLLRHGADVTATIIRDDGFKGWTAFEFANPFSDIQTCLLQAKEVALIPLSKPIKTTSSTIEITSNIIPQAMPEEKKISVEEMLTIGTQNLQSYVQTVEKEGYAAHHLRQYQFRCIKEYAQFRVDLLNKEKTNPKAVFECATGSGKTYIFTRIALITKEPTLIIVPRDILLTQSKESIEQDAKLLNIDVKNQITFLQAKHHKKGLTTASCKAIRAKYRILLTTYQTMILHHDKLDWKHLHVVCDEAHHALSERWQQLITNKLNQPDTLMSFFTATPIGLKKYSSESDENTKIPLAASCYELAGYYVKSENPISGLSIQQAIDDEVNCPVVTAIIQATHIAQDELSLLKKNGSHISQEKAAKLVDKEEYNKMTVEIYCNGKDPQNQKPFRGEQGVVFCAGINHAKHVAEEFNKIAIEVIDPDSSLRNAYIQRYTEVHGAIDSEKTQELREAFCIAKAIHSDNLDNKECQEILTQYKLGGILILTGADKLTEGFDHRATSIIFNMRPTNSHIVSKQRSGRGLRKDPNHPHKICYIFDFDWKLPKQIWFCQYLIDETAHKLSTSWGKVNECRAGYSMSDETMLSIPIFNSSQTDSFSISWEPPTGKVMLTANDVNNAMNRQPKINKNENSTSSKRNGWKLTIPSIAQGLTKLNEEISALENLFKTLSNVATLEESNLLEEGNHSPKSDADVEMTIMDAQPSSSLPPQKKPEETHFGMATRSVTNKLATVNHQLDALQAFLLLPTTRHIMTKSVSSSAEDKDEKPEKTINPLPSLFETIQAIFSKSCKLRNRIQMLLQQSLTPTLATARDQETSEIDEISKELQFVATDLRKLVETISTRSELFESSLQASIKTSPQQQAPKAIALPKRRNKPNPHTKKSYPKEKEEKKNQEKTAVQNFLGKHVGIDFFKLDALYKTIIAEYKSNHIYFTILKTLAQTAPELMAKQNEQGETFFHLELMRQDKWQRGGIDGLIKALIYAPNILNNKQQSLLHTLCQLTPSVSKKSQYSFYEWLTALIAHHVKLDLQDHLGNTALHYTILQPNSMALMILLAVGANPQISNELGLTPIQLYDQMYSSSKYNNAELEHLIKKIAIEKIDINLTDAHGDTCLHKELIIQSTLYHFFLERGINVNIQNKQGNTALHNILLHTSARGKNYSNDFIFSCLKHHLNLSLQNADGQTVLHCAFSNIMIAHRTGIMALIDNATVEQINLRDNNNNTAMHILAEKTFPIIEITRFGAFFKTLVEKNADLTAENVNKKTPIDILCEAFSDCIFSLEIYKRSETIAELKSLFAELISPYLSTAARDKAEATLEKCQQDHEEQLLKMPPIPKSQTSMSLTPSMTHDFAQYLPPVNFTPQKTNLGTVYHSSVFETPRFSGYSIDGGYPIRSNKREDFLAPNSPLWQLPPPLPIESRLHPVYGRNAYYHPQISSSMQLRPMQPMLPFPSYRSMPVAPISTMSSSAPVTEPIKTYQLTRRQPTINSVSSSQHHFFNAAERTLRPEVSPANTVKLYKDMVGRDVEIPSECVNSSTLNFKHSR